MDWLMPTASTVQCAWCLMMGSIAGVALSVSEVSGELGVRLHAVWLILKHCLLSGQGAQLCQSQPQLSLPWQRSDDCTLEMDHITSVIYSTICLLIVFRNSIVQHSTKQCSLLFRWFICTLCRLMLNSHFEAYFTIWCSFS